MTLAEVVSAARSQGRRLLNEVEAKQVLAEAAGGVRWAGTAGAT